MSSNRKNPPRRVELTSSKQILPEEITHIKNLLCELIQATSDVDCLKTHLRYALGFSGETLEMQQLHMCQLDHLKRYEEIKKEVKVLKAALLALGALVGALVGAPNIIHFLVTWFGG